MTDIKFTTDQFEALLKLAYIGNWIINANRTSDRIKEFEEVEAYLFSKTALFGLEEHLTMRNLSIPLATLNREK